MGLDVSVNNIGAFLRKKGYREADCNPHGGVPGYTVSFVDGEIHVSYHTPYKSGYMPDELLAESNRRVDSLCSILADAYDCEIVENEKKHINILGKLGTFRELSKHLMNPDKSGYKACLEAINESGCEDVAVAMECFEARDLVPTDWFTSEERSFYGDCDCSSGPGCNRCGGTGKRGTNTPQHINSLVSYASNIKVIRRVELLAKNVFIRMSCWGVKPPNRIMWVDEKHSLRFAGWTPRPWKLIETLKDLKAEVEPTGSELEDALKSDIAWANHFYWARREGLRVPNNSSYLKPTGDQMSVYWDDVPDPFEPLMEIWRLGYALIGIKDSYIVLMNNSSRPKV